MSTTQDLQSIASEYAQSVRAYFTPPKLSREISADRGMAARVISSEQETRASAALARSTEFNAIAQTVLPQSESFDLQLQALAKLSSDLEVARDLMEAGDELEAGTLTVQVAGERSLNSLALLETQLNLVEGRATARASAERGAIILRDIDTARTELSSSLDSAILLIPERTTTVSQKVINKVFDFGLTNIAHAIGQAIEAAASLLNQSENLNALIELGRKFLKNVYDLAMQILGDVGLEVIKEKIQEWVDDKLQLRDDFLANWVKKLCQADATQVRLQKAINDSDTPLEQYAQAITDVDVMTSNFQKYTGVMDKALDTVGFLKGIAILKTPSGILAITGVLLLLMSVMMLTGAALLDSPEVRALQQVRGIDDIITRNLKITPSANKPA